MHTFHLAPYVSVNVQDVLGNSEMTLIFEVCFAQNSVFGAVTWHALLYICDPIEHIKRVYGNFRFSWFQVSVSD